MSEYVFDCELTGKACPVIDYGMVHEDGRIPSASWMEHKSCSTGGYRESRRWDASGILHISHRCAHSTLRR